jgi:hypothetical protein
MRREQKIALDRAVQRGRLRYHDPFGLGALKTLIELIPKRCEGLTQVQLKCAAEELRDVADTLDVMADC